MTAVARSTPEIDELVSEIQRLGGKALAFPGDVREASFTSAAVAAASERFGGLQILVNNAGIGLFTDVAQTSDAQWDDVIATNLTAPFRLTRAALPHLARRGGHVIMVSSLAGANANPGMAAYAASKAALDHFARCLLLEVRSSGVKVSVVAPGSVDTRFSGPALSRGASWKLTADDVATTVLDLLRLRDQAHASRVELRPTRPDTK